MSKKDKTRNRLLTYKETYILYFLCGVTWVVSAIISVIEKDISVFDFVIGGVFILIGVLYVIKDNKSK